jgi:uncharacterized protein
MLYDQAQLAVSYLEAFQITGGAVMERAARRTLDYVLRDMTAPEGGFWSAEDADSAGDPARPEEKSEGAFYIWSRAEVVSLLGEERAEEFSDRYGMEREGNVRNDPQHEFEGRNILFWAKDEPGTWGEDERILFEARAKRLRPHLDDKILTSWNGLMISAFAKAAAIFNDPRYVAAARNAADFILGTLVEPDGAVLRRYRAGRAGIAGMLDDYAFFSQALLDLYEATFEYRYLERAIAITAKQRQLMEDAEGGGFFASAHDDTSRLMRLKDDYDGAEPSGNSVALMNLLRLSRITGVAEYEESARKLISAFQERLTAAPFALPQMLCACEFDLAPPREIVVAGERQGEMIRMLRNHFDPNRILLHASPELERYQPAMSAMRARDGVPSVYICENFTCSAPVHTPEDLSRLLK